MSNQFSLSSNDESSKYLSAQENRDRRLIEMYRRLKSLQARRFHLKKELEALEKCLVSLDNQIKGYEAYDQLSLN